MGKSCFAITFYQYPATQKWMSVITAFVKPIITIMLMHIDKLALAQRKSLWLSTEKVAPTDLTHILLFVCPPPNTSCAVPPPSPLLSRVGHLAVRALELSHCPLICPSAATERHSLPASSPSSRLVSVSRSSHSRLPRVAKFTARRNLLSPSLLFLYFFFASFFFLGLAIKINEQRHKGGPGRPAIS